MLKEERCIQSLIKSPCVFTMVSRSELHSTTLLTNQGDTQMTTPPFSSEWSKYKHLTLNHIIYRAIQSINPMILISCKQTMRVPPNKAIILEIMYYLIKISEPQMFQEATFIRNLQCYASLPHYTQGHLVLQKHYKPLENA